MPVPESDPPEYSISPSKSARDANLDQKDRYNNAGLPSSSVKPLVSRSHASEPKPKDFPGDTATWAERSQVLINTLNAVAQIHPVVAAVVVVFQTAVHLELQRRDNDSKVGALRVQRLEMMSVLTDLKNVSDSDALTNDTRFAELLQTIAEDIKSCAQLCDKYVRRSLFVKVVKSDPWAYRLNEYSDRFQKRKSEIHLALSFYTARGVNRLSGQLGNVLGTADSIHEKINLLLFFQTLESPTARALKDTIDAKGGTSKVIGDDALLKEIMEELPVAFSNSVSRVTEHASVEDENAQLQLLKEELGEKIDTMLHKERDFFERKFDAQTKQLETTVETHVTRWSDRVIETLSSGPWVHIEDKLLAKMWKDMGWKSNTTTHQFTLALREYLTRGYAILEEHSADKSNLTLGSTSEWVGLLRKSLPMEDKWTLTYIDGSHMSSISEAFNDHANVARSITVQDLNDLTSSLPLGFSLPRWVAYWALGWHLSLLEYLDKIDTEIVPRMLNLARNVLVENRGKVDRYLCSFAFRSIHAIARSVNSSKDKENLLKPFQDYVTGEEKRLEDNLKALRYKIDALNTLALVTGPGPVERFLLPLIYLLLSHHYRLIDLCTREVVPEEDFISAAGSLASIYAAAQERADNLEEICEHHALDIDSESERVAHGMFEYVCFRKEFDWRERTDEYPFSKSTQAPVSGRLETKPSAAAQTTSAEETFYDDALFSPQSDPESQLNLIGGLWDGVLQKENDSDLGRISFRLDADDNGQFFGRGIDRHKAFTIRTHDSEISADPHKRVGGIVLRLNYQHESDNNECIDISGTLSEDGRLTGDWKSTADISVCGHFVVQRCAQLSINRSHPRRGAVEESRGRALWAVARTAVRQYLWTWAYWAERRNTRIRFMELYQQRTLSKRWGNLTPIKSLSKTEEEELRSLQVCLTVADQQFYVTLAIRETDVRHRHYRTSCEICKNSLLDVRFSCAICIGHTVNSTIDLCVNHCDMNARRPDGIVHDNSHPMFKARRIIYFRDILRLRNLARQFHGLEPVKLPSAGSGSTNSDVEWEDTSSDGSRVVGTESYKMSILTCIRCERMAKGRYYLCMDSACLTGGQAVICEACEREENASSWKTSTHKPEHLLLRLTASENVSLPEEAPTVAESTSSRSQRSSVVAGSRQRQRTRQRVALLERAIAKYEHHFDRVHDRLDRYAQHCATLETKLEESNQRLSRIESCLQRIVAGTETTSTPNTDNTSNKKHSLKPKTPSKRKTIG